MQAGRHGVLNHLMRCRNIIHGAATGICIFLSSAATVQSSEVIASDTIWQGKRMIIGDLIIPEGITLTISSGSEVLMTSKREDAAPAGTEAPLPRILVQGHLEVEGDEGSPVVISAAGDNGSNRWQGIVIDDGNAWLHKARIQGAETAVHIRKGWVKLKKSVLTNNCCGVVITGANSGTKIESSTISENNYGLIVDDKSVISILSSTLHENREKNIFFHSENDGAGLTDVCRCDGSHEQNRTSGQKENPTPQKN